MRDRKAELAPRITFLDVYGTGCRRAGACTHRLPPKVSDGRSLEELSANRSRPPLDREGWRCGIMADALADAISSARFLLISEAIRHDPEGRLMHHAQNDVRSY